MANVQMILLLLQHGAKQCWVMKVYISVDSENTNATKAQIAPPTFNWASKKFVTYKIVILRMWNNAK